MIKDFYTVTLPDGSLSDHFEKAFSQIEGSAATALGDILAGNWPIKGELREAFANWVALQHLRSEDIRIGQRDLSAGIIRLLVGISGKEALRSIIQAAESRTVPDEELDWEWRDITKPDGPDITPDANRHIRLMLSLLSTTTAHLRDCHWTLFKFDRRSIVTSDHPVSLVASPDSPAWQGVGIATAELFLVPLSRRAAMTIQRRDRFSNLIDEPSSVPDFTTQGTTKVAQIINQETVARSRKYVYHHPDDSPLARLYLPQSDTRDQPFPNIEGLIREEGIFNGIPESSRRALASSNPPGGAEEGLTIDDIPWPIPGRRPRVNN